MTHEHGGGYKWRARRGDKVGGGSGGFPRHLTRTQRRRHAVGTIVYFY